MRQTSYIGVTAHNDLRFNLFVSLRLRFDFTSIFLLFRFRFRLRLRYQRIIRYQSIMYQSKIEFARFLIRKCLEVFSAQFLPSEERD